MEREKREREGGEEEGGEGGGGEREGRWRGRGKEGEGRKNKGVMCVLMQCSHLGNVLSSQAHVTLWSRLVMY